MVRQLASFVTIALGRVTRPGILRELAAGAGSGTVIMVANTVLSVASAILLARLLGVEGYGVYGFAIAVASILSVAAELGLPTLVVREAARATHNGDLGKLRGFVAVCACLILAATALIGAATYLVVEFASLELAPMERAALILVIPLVGLMASIRFGAGVLMGMRRLVAAQVVGELLPPLLFFCGIAILATAIPTIATPQSILILQIAISLMVVLSCLFLLRSLASRSAALAPTPMQSILKAGWPFLLIGSALLINQQIGTVVIGALIGTAEVGYFRVASQGAAFSTFGVLVLTKVAAPYFAQLHEAGDYPSMARLFAATRWLGFASCLVALAIFAIAGEWLIAISFGPDFIEAAPLLVVLTCGFAGNAFFGPVGALLSMSGHEAYSARVLWAVAVATTIGSVLGAKIAGVMGVAVVMAAATTFYHLLLRRVVRRHLHF